MKIRSLLTLAGLANSFAVPASMAQDAMKAQIVNVLGDPTKAELENL
jgi:hypothetical protein